MRFHRVWLATLLAFGTFTFHGELTASEEAPSKDRPADAAATAKEKTAEAKPDLHPGPPRDVTADELNAAIQRGVAYLVKDQNRDGSWGSAERTKDLNIIAGIGSHHAFRTATTALCVAALIEADDGSTEVRLAIERGEAFLFEQLPLVRRDDPMLIYNVWTHAYGIQTLARMYARLPEDAARREKIAALIRGQYERLQKYESAEGGWGYYDFEAGTQRPASSSTSFVNAAVLVAFDEARRIGVDPPKKLADRGVQMLKVQQKPDFTYLYGTYLRNNPMHPVNRPGGSLGRSQACNLALRLWGDKSITDDVMKEWLDRLITRNGWLDMGRKRPVPHESHFAVAGYFYYFGHYYAARTIPVLPDADRTFYRNHLALILMKLQEKDGSWWDYPLYNYHQQYGTAFALMSLHQCRR
ncbi:MAG: hypothetical protein AABP62_18615 [Planctomycetota bacterium]